ncbi:SDR family NAD(P)-dependent oxidoreductase [Brevibacillus parabrevis]|uniref:SDR family NAD(P)-dependent oxidoreductase n=1 Tax=Brevibacillus parabrevis TaxID=54914 RepID=UPI002E245A7C|nr:SDR family NAD(P)-dependent oxidoreductase [Brevibacillus parabrevis]
MGHKYDDQTYTGLEIAVIGMDCKFPKANDANQFWDNLKNGVEGISFFSEEEMLQSGIDPALCNDPNYVKAKGYLEGIDQFDSAFFDYTPREATVLDPQIRVFHEVVLNALEHAGYNPEVYKGQIGLYAGSTENVNWLLRQMLANETPTFNVSFREYLCTSISYKLKLKGPSVSVLSACSTSLVAVHLASQALLNGECSIAVAGGVHISLPSKKGYYYSDDLIYSPDGHCRAFDASSAGTLISDGAGVVVLKTLQDAIKDQDHIYAVIKGSAINNDGHRKAGFSAPSIQGQKEVIEAALQMAEVDAESITMVEAHGTGTKIGDSIEVEALKRAFQTNKKAYCAIGSVKSSIGHLNEAAGIAGLIKTILSLDNKQIPPSLHVLNPNPKIEFENTPFYINHSLRDWNQATTPRRAAVSSFGIGGTNAHVILEEAPIREKRAATEEARLFVFSAKTKTALQEQISRFKSHLKQQPNIDLRDAAYTLQAGRMALSNRAYLIARSYQELLPQLDAKSLPLRTVEKGEATALYLVPEITGDAHIAQLALALYQNYRPFREEMTQCLGKIGSHSKLDLQQLFAPGVKDATQLRAIHFLFVYAFAKVTFACQEQPFGIVGFRSGNFVAVTLAEAVALEHAFVAFLDNEITAITENPISQPRIPLFSAGNGEKLFREHCQDRSFWHAALTAPLSFAAGLAALCQTPKTIVAFLGNNTETAGDYAGLPVQEWVSLSVCEAAVWTWIGELWSRGATIHWEALHKRAEKGRIPLPTYPFERNRYFLDDDPVKLGNAFLQQIKEQASAQKDAADWYYAPTWKRAAFSESSAKSAPKLRRSAIIFHDTRLDEAVVEACKRHFEQPFFVARNGAPVAGADNGYGLADNSKAAYQDALQAFDQKTQAEPDAILYFSLSEEDFVEEDQEQAERMLEENYDSLLHLVQALDERDGSTAFQLAVVANRLFDVLGSEEINPWKATLLGLVRGIPLEFPDRSCQLIDISGQEQLVASGLVDQLLQEIEGRQDELFALRGKAKWLPHYDRTSPVSRSGAKLKDDGVYLLTGGIGGIGLELADYIASHCKSSIILVGRSFFPAKEEWGNWLRDHGKQDPISVKIARMQKLEQKGARVFVYQADVSDFSALAATLRRAQQEAGAIQGVIHAAGLPGSSLIQQATKEATHRVIHSKASGCLNLSRILRENDLDFFVLCSSISTISPMIGQSDYNAANAFLDAYADYRNREGKVAFTNLKWDIWKNVGMAVKSGIAPASKQALEHPLFDYSFQAGGKELFFARLTLQQHWVLQDHRTEEHGVLSGTALIEMVREAAGKSMLKKPYVLQNVHFQTPITVREQEEKEVLLLFTPNSSEGYSFTVYSRMRPEADTWLPHVTGTVETVEQPLETVNLEALKERCADKDVLFTDADHKKHGGYLIFGERWRNIRQVMAGKAEGLAVIELPEKYAADLDDYHLHPGMLDSATSFLLGFIDKTEMFIPLSYESLAVYGKMPRRIYSYCKYLDVEFPQDGLASFDIQIMDEAGRVLVEIRNYTMIAVSGSVAERISDGNRQSITLDLAKWMTAGTSGHDLGQVGILPEKGREIFGKMLASGASTVIISTTDLESRVQKRRDSNQDGWGRSDEQQSTSVRIQGKRPPLSVEYVPPQTDLQKALCAIYENDLGIAPIGIADDFFELGGDSLKAIHVSTSIRKQFHANMTLTDFFQEKTIEHIAAFIQNNQQARQQAIAPVAAKPHYMTSLAQQRVFFLQGLVPNTVGYNESTAVLLEGSIEPEKIERIFAKIIERHESLRTSFQAVDGEIVQIVHPHVDFRVISLTSDEHSVERDVEQFIQPFDLTQAPLFRVGLIKLGEQKSVLALDIHHIISDGTSINLLIKDFAELYSGKSLPPLAVQYKDYAEWQHAFAQSAAYRAQKAYWLQQLEGKLPVLHLPTDFPRPASLSFDGNRIIVELDQQLSENIKKFSQEQQVTWFMTMLAAYYAWLARLSGESDILVGIPQAGRNHEDVKEIVGMFVNSLVLRNRPEREKSFRGFLHEVKASLLAALENQDFHIELILDQLDVKRDPSRTFLYDTIFNYQSMKNRAEDAGTHDGDLQLSAYPVTAKTTKADLNIHLYETGAGICLECFYRTDLFRQETVEYLFAEYRKLLASITQNPDLLIGELPILQQSEVRGREKAVVPSCEYQPFSFDEPAATVVSRFEQQVAQYPDQIAVKHGSAVLDYRQLNARANRVARKIAERTAQTSGHAPVALLFGNTLDMAVALIGALKAGVPFVPLDRSAPAERLAYMLGDTQSAILLTDSQNFALAAEVAGKAMLDITTINLSEETGGASEENLELSIKGEDIAFILYTSGSTGRPKGVMQSHANVYYYLAQLSKELRLHSQDRIALLTSYSHAIGILDILGSLLNGAALHLYDFKLDGSMPRFAHWLNQEQITLFHSVPSVFRFFMKNLDDAVQLPHIRMVLLGGEVVSGTDFDLYKQKCADDCLFVNFLGCSELMVISFYIMNKNMAVPQAKTPAGYVVDGIELRILDESGREVSIFESGQLFYQSDYLSPGYWNRPQETANAFVGDPRTGTGRLYRSGDYGRLLPDGCLEYNGRNDSQLKIRGYRVDLNEIESVIDGLDCMLKSVVKAIDDENGEPVIVAYYVLKQSEAEKAIIGQVKQLLPSYLVPSFWLELQSFPMVGPNKIDRNALPAVEATRPRSSHIVPPQNRMEELLVSIWQDILGKEPVGVDDGFFELGGHSLLLMQVQNRLEKEWQTTIEMADLFKYPTIRSLASFLQDKQISKTDYLQQSTQRGELRKSLRQQRGKR